MTIRVKSPVSHLGIRDAIAVDPWTWCEAGQHVVKEKDMAGRDICHACNCEIDERRPNGEALKARKEHGDKLRAGAQGQPGLPFEALEGGRT